jgi:hypothetical protein
MQGTPPVIPVIGASTVAQLDELLGAGDLCLDEDVRKRLDAAGHGTDLRPARAHRRWPALWDEGIRRPLRELSESQ